MDKQEAIAIWTTSIISKLEKLKQDETFIPRHELLKFLTDNYELFHLYPDNAVLDEIHQFSKQGD
jgi:hypothetical protein